MTLTKKGAAELKQWINLPVTQHDVASGVRELMLRFAYSEAVLGRAASVQLLRGFKAELQSTIRRLRSQTSTPKLGMPLSGALALESGVRGHECLLEWCEYALKIYRQRTTK